MKTVKKLFAVMLAGMMCLSVAACNNDADTKNQPSSQESVASKDSQTSMTYEMIVAELEPDEKVKEEIEKNIDVEKLGPKTKEALKVIENKNFTISIKLEVEQPEEDGETSDDEASFSISEIMSMVEDSEITIIKKGDALARFIVDVGGMMGMDRLNTPDGTYTMNTKRKTATKVDENDTSDIKTAVKLMGLDVDVDAIADEASEAMENSEAVTAKENTTIELIGDGTDTFKGSELALEKYKLSGKRSAAIFKQTSQEESMDENEIVETNVTLYFSGNALKYIVFGDEQRKLIFTFKDYSTAVDESQLSIPSNYKVIDATEESSES